MTMSGDGKSVRNLPPGRLQDLKKMFEEKDARASGATLYGMTTPQAAASSQPKPTGQQGLGDRKTWIAPDFMPTPKPVNIFSREDKLKTPLQRGRSFSERQEYSSNAEGKAAAQKRLSPTVSGQISHFTGDSKNGKELTSVEQRFKLSEASRPGNLRRMSDLTSDKSGSGQPTVLDRSRRFEEKPSLTNKPTVTIRGQNMPSISNAPKRFVGKSRQGDLNGDTGVANHSRNFEQANVFPDNQSLAVGRQRGASSAASFLFKTQNKPGEELPQPPSKPPRTFAHDEYMKSKGSEESMDTIRRASVGSDSSDTHKVTMRDGSKDMLSYLPENQMRTDGGRELSPSRVPPNRLRPISEASSLLRPKDPSPIRTNDSEDEGPVVISLRTRKRLDHRASVSGPHRRPDDELPKLPKEAHALQRSGLRKSFSSENLHKGSLSSLSGTSRDDLPRTSAVHTFHDEDNSGEGQYEALIDSSGYAVPHGFLRINIQNEQEPDSGGRSSVLTTTPVKEQDVEKVPRRKLNMVRQKINQAYESLYEDFTILQPAGEGQEADQLAILDDTDSGDSDSVDAKEIKKRVNYCTTVRLKTYQTISKTKEFMEKIYPQLFEYAMIVSLCAATDHPGFEPTILHKFPMQVDCNVSVPKFCFPDAEEFKPGSVINASETYSFVLTNIDGGRSYGYCRRVQPPDSSLAEVICIVSPLDAFNMYDKTIHALVALLYPFHWQHVYIPLLPPDMLDVCAAPMPFLIGILHSHLARVTQLELEDVIIVNLDNKQVERSVGDELTILPKKLQKALKTAVNMSRIDSDAGSNQWLMVSEAFLRLFVETMGHFGQHIATQQDGSKTLLREAFIRGVPSKGIRQMLEWFTETQMFEVFINMQLQQQHWSSMDLFMVRLAELQSKRQSEGSHKGITRKVKDLGKAIKTKLK